MTEEVRDLAALSLQRPVRLAADAAGAAPKTLQQEIIRLKVRTQDFLLSNILHVLERDSILPATSHARGCLRGCSCAQDSAPEYTLLEMKC